MSKQKYDNQIIIEYLLGSLPEAEAEHFDELSFIDDELADALKAAEKDLIDAYIQGELTGATLGNFKSHYLASPVRRRNVNFAKAFQVFAERRIAETNAENLAQEPKTKQSISDFFPFINIFTISNSLGQWGFAAIFLMFIALGGLWIINNRQTGQESKDQTKRIESASPVQELTKQIEGQDAGKLETEKEVAITNNEIEQPPQKLVPEQTKKLPVTGQSGAVPKEHSAKPSKITVASFILTPPMRSGNQIPNLSIPVQPGEIAIRLQLESDDYRDYRVALVNQADKNLWSSGRLKTKSAGENKILDVRVPARHLKSQIFSLVVSGIKANGKAEIISNYPFRAVLK